MDHKALLRLACEIAKESPDPSTQNGAFLVDDEGKPFALTMAINEFPLGVSYSNDRWARPIKYSYIEHAERNAIFSAAKYGIRTQGLTLVAGWAACADCARAIIQAGIRSLVTLGNGQTNDRWDASIAVAMGMLEEAGVEVIEIPGPIGECPELLRNGELFQP